METPRIETLEAKTTALVVIDLQKGIVGGGPYAPHSSSEVVANAVRLAEMFTEKNAFIALVRVSSKDFKDWFVPRTDLPAAPVQMPPEGWDDLVPELQAFKNAHLVTKKNPGAFYGTDLDLQLRRRGITTIVLCGISTVQGVEMTARDANQHAYHQVFAEDAMAAASKELHDHVCQNTFPRMGKIRLTSEISL